MSDNIYINYSIIKRLYKKNTRIRWRYIRIALDSQAMQRNMHYRLAQIALNPLVE